MYLMIGKAGGEIVQTDRPITAVDLAACTVLQLGDNGFYYYYGTANLVPYIPPYKRVKGWPATWNKITVMPSDEGLPAFVNLNNSTADFGSAALAERFANEVKSYGWDERVVKISWGNRRTGEVFTMERFENED